MFCFKCGANMPETATVCAQCGTPVQGAPQTPSAPPSNQPGQPASPWQSAPVMQPPQYSASQPGTQPQPGMQPPTDGKATASLVLGILSVTCFWIFAGIPAVILGHMSRKRIRESMGRLKGDGMALAGLVMGYLSVFVGIAPILIIAAIAIPNLLRSRMAANDSAAMATVRNINTAQASYSVQYGNGYARELAILGSGGTDCSGLQNVSAQHACLVTDTIAGPGCTAGNWCAKTGFQYSLTAVCDARACSDYVLTATPVTENTGTRSFCSTSDAVVRFRRGGPLTTPLTSVDECQAWAPI